MTESGEELKAPPSHKDKVPKYERPWLLICAICSIGPFALPLIWRHPRIQWYWKLYLTLMVIGITWACIVLTNTLWDDLKEKWDIIRELEA